jgi:hypothetical protein
MQDKQSLSNNSIDSVIQEFKPCAGKGCNNLGVHRLSIIYINKTGLFCETCKKELERCGLVIRPNIKNSTVA